MIEVTLDPEMTDNWYRYRCLWNGKEYVTNRKQNTYALNALMRNLIEDGCPDQSWDVVKSGKRIMYGPSIKTVANRQLNENDTGFSNKEYKPFPEILKK